MTHHQQTSIAEIKGIVGNRKTLHELGIYDISDLLNYFPYRYDDYELRDLEEVKHEERVTVEGKVHSEPSLTYYGKTKQADIQGACRQLFNYRGLL